MKIRLCKREFRKYSDTSGGVRLTLGYERRSKIDNSETIKSTRGQVDVRLNRSVKDVQSLPVWR